MYLIFYNQFDIKILKKINLILFLTELPSGN
nr:MAG TPA: hypothetical protein [Bacteriophage sp.]